MAVDVATRALSGVVVRVAVAARVALEVAVAARVVVAVAVRVTVALGASVLVGELRRHSRTLRLARRWCQVRQQTPPSHR
ncbi:MAG: hypothetical protein AB1817_04270 [Chloroflexota bacterium]